MAQSLIIRNQCDRCLEAGKETPADTYRVALRVMPPAAHVEAATPAREADNPRPFDVELCPEHGAALCDAVMALVPLGRPADGKAPARPAVTRVRPDKAATGVTCPECGYTCGALATMRPHVRKEHGKSLAGVGLVPSNVTCPTCGDGFPNRQGMAAHTRSSHPGIKQPA